VPSIVKVEDAPDRPGATHLQGNSKKRDGALRISKSKSLTNYQKREGALRSIAFLILI
jgi:hypothetical protein